MNHMKREEFVLRASCVPTSNPRTKFNVLPFTSFIVCICVAMFAAAAALGYDGDQRSFEIILSVTAVSSTPTDTAAYIPSSQQQILFDYNVCPNPHAVLVVPTGTNVAASNFPTTSNSSDIIAACYGAYIGNNVYASGYVIRWFAVSGSYVQYSSTSCPHPVSIALSPVTNYLYVACWSADSGSTTAANADKYLTISPGGVVNILMESSSQNHYPMQITLRPVGDHQSDFLYLTQSWNDKTLNRYNNAIVSWLHSDLTVPQLPDGQHCAISGLMLSRNDSSRAYMGCTDAATQNLLVMSTNLTGGDPRLVLPSSGNCMSPLDSIFSMAEIPSTGLLALPCSGAALLLNPTNLNYTTLIPQSVCDSVNHLQVSSDSSSIYALCKNPSYVDALVVVSFADGFYSRIQLHVIDFPNSVSLRCVIPNGLALRETNNGSSHQLLVACGKVSETGAIASYSFCANYAVPGNAAQGNCTIGVSYIEGTFCTASCPLGFELSQSHTCSSGLWTQASCVPVRCPYYSIPPSATSNCSGNMRYEFGTVCSVTGCDAGFDMKRADDQQCSASSIWLTLSSGLDLSVSTSVCQRKPCLAYQLPLHSSSGNCTAGSDEAYGTYCQAVCDGGYSSHGVSWCDTMQVWQNLQLCSPITCSSKDWPIASAGASHATFSQQRCQLQPISLTGGVATYQVGASCRASCASGFVESSNADAGLTITCQVDGSWSTPPSSATLSPAACLLEACAYPADGSLPARSSLTNCSLSAAQSYEYVRGSVCNAVCDSGYQISNNINMSSSHSIICNHSISGPVTQPSEWLGVTDFSCQPLPCQAPLNASSIAGLLQSCESSFNSGSTCSIICMSGYVVAGSVYSCSKGVLSGGPQSCSPASCHLSTQLPPPSALDPHTTYGSCATSVAGSTLPHGHSCSFACDSDNFKLNGSSSLICLFGQLRGQQSCILDPLAQFIFSNDAINAATMQVQHYLLPILLFAQWLMWCASL